MTDGPTHLHQAIFGNQARIVSSNLTQTIDALEFLKRRFERDREMLSNLSHAPDSAASLGVLTAFCARSLSDYGAEATRLSRLIAATVDLVGDGMQDEVSALMAGTALH